MDTGARTSAIHALWVSETTKNDTPHVTFWIIPGNGKKRNEHKYCLPIVDKRWVKNSFGISEMRYVIQLPIKIGKDKFLTEFTLSNRWKMAYQVLIGRNVLKHKYVVNASKSYELGK